MNNKYEDIKKCEYLPGAEILPSNWGQIIEQDKFTYYPFGKAFEQQIQKQVGALKFLNLSDKTDKLKRFKVILKKPLLNDLIIDKINEIIQLQIIIKLNELD